MASSFLVRYKCDDVVLDTDRFRFERGGVSVRVHPQEFAGLSNLMQHRERAVPETEPHDTIWNDRFVSESALKNRINRHRRRATMGSSSNESGRARQRVWVARRLRPR